MADAASLSLVVPALAASALQSSKLLCETLASLQNNSRTVGELKEELESLRGVLEAFQEMASNEHINLEMLGLPLRRCSKICKDIQAQIVKSIACSGGSWISFRDWAKLRYMGEDLTSLKNTLAGFRSIFMIALADAELRTSALTRKAIEEYKDMTMNTTADLEKHLQEIDEKLQAFSLQVVVPSAEIAQERRQIQEEIDSIKQCLSICAQASTQLYEVRSNTFEDISVDESSHQVIITAIRDLFSAKRVTAGQSSRALVGQMSDAHLAHLVSLHARDDSSISGLGDQSSASSITSLVDSVFSVTSGSSKSSVVGPAGAGERLVALLLRDNHLSSLYQEALQRVTADKFERNFRRILKQFAIELRKEAENPQQRSIAHFVRHRARNSAHVVRNSICSLDKPQEDTTLKFKGFYEPISIESDESGDDSGPDHEDNADLQQLEDFIIMSQAFVELRHQLTSFISLNSKEEVDDKGKHKLVNEIDNKGKIEEQENTGTTQDKNLPVRNNCKPENEWSSRWHITRFVAHLREFWEPRVHEGKIRIRWKCKCGQYLYDDYVEMQRGAAKCLEESLNQRPRSGDTFPARRSPTHLTTVGGLIPNIFTRVRRALSIEEQRLPLQHLPPTASIQHIVTSQSSLAEALFLLICHNASIYDKKLLQLSICDIKSDKGFFRALKKHYQSKYTKWSSLVSLRTITGIKFVKFELYRKSQSVDIRLMNDMPPPENPEYCYTPVPADLVPPVGENQLMHFLDDPDCAEDVLACLDRFPKKLKDKLACGDKAIAPGWGLDLEEGVCKKKTVIVYMVCVLVSSIWGILWTVLGHDIQGAFSVSAYMIGITVPLVTLMQYLA